MLDDLELPQVQEIGTRELRVLAEHKPPGMSGSLLQNLGRRPTRVVLWGVATGPTALDFTKKLDAKFRAAKPLPFTADVVADAKLDKVLIEDVKFEQVAGKPERYSFLLTLREYIKPIEPETVAGIDSSIADDGLKLGQNLTSGLDVLKQLTAAVANLTALSGKLK
jgi:hypothetical protein